MTAAASEPPGFPEVIYGPPRLLSRWEFGGRAYVLVTASAADNGNLTLEYMPEEAYRLWAERDARRRARASAAR